MPKTILIVEDNQLNMRLIDDLLRAHGYSTLKSTDGTGAVSLAEEHLPNLILMDIQLPNISGLEITKTIKEKDELKHIPVVAVTAFAMQGDENMILASGCDDYIAKPISIQNLLATVADNIT